MNYLSYTYYICYREECKIILLFLYIFHGSLSCAAWLVSRMIACTPMECHAYANLLVPPSLTLPPHWSFFSLFLRCPLPLPHPPALLRRWLYGKTVCSMYAFCGMLFGICSLTTLTLLSMVCFVKVCYPLYGKSSKKLFFAQWNDIWINHHTPKWTIVDLSREGWGDNPPMKCRTLASLWLLTSAGAALNKNYLWCWLMEVQMGLLFDLEKECFPRQRRKTVEKPLT